MRFLKSELTFTEMMDEAWYFVLFIARSENTYILSFINLAILLSKKNYSCRSSRIFRRTNEPGRTTAKHSTSGNNTQPYGCIFVVKT